MGRRPRRRRPHLVRRLSLHRGRPSTRVAGSIPLLNELIVSSRNGVLCSAVGALKAALPLLKPQGRGGGSGDSLGRLFDGRCPDSFTRIDLSMLSRIVRALPMAVALMAAAITASLAGDPWNTGNPWNAPRPAASDVQPLNSASSLPSVAGVPSVASVPSVRWGVVPTPAAPPRGTTAVPAVTAKDISLRGNAAAGAHIVMMKCARCHGQDGSGGAELVGLSPSRR